MAIHNTADNSFKRIFDDHRLFVEFIRDFIKIDILEDIKPEDIEDLSERFLPLFQENRDADTVKRINLKDQTPRILVPATGRTLNIPRYFPLSFMTAGKPGQRKGTFWSAPTYRRSLKNIYPSLSMNL